MSDSMLDFDAVTEEDFAQIDAAVAKEFLKSEESINPDVSIEFETAGAVDLATLTDEDFAVIDAAIAIAQRGLPQIQVELEHPHSPQAEGGSSGVEDIKKMGAQWPNPVHPSPMGRFRTNTILSVTDLAAPNW